MSTFEIISAIKARMKEVGCTQKKLSEMVDASEPTVHCWLALKTNVPSWAVFGMLHSLGLDLQIVYMEDNERRTED